MGSALSCFNPKEEGLTEPIRRDNQSLGASHSHSHINNNVTDHMKSETSSLYNQLDTTTSIRTDNVIGYKLGYSEVKNRYIVLEGTWLGNVMGSLKMKKRSFINNTQLFLRAYEPTKVTFVLEQDSFFYDHQQNKKRSACIMLFKMKNNGKRVTAFNESNLFAKSIVSQKSVKLTCNLEPTPFPYIIVVTHTTSQEGQYRLGVECYDREKQVSINVPRTYTRWFNTGPHRISITASFDGKTVTPENHPGNWIKDAMQIPIMCDEPTRVLVRLTRTSKNPLSMGCFLVKSDGEATSDSYYPYKTLQENTIVGRHDRFVSTNILEFRAFLQPKRYPYIFFPVTEYPDEVGDFELEVFSDNELKNVQGARIKQRYEDSGVWYERSCGADGHVGSKKSFFRCPQFFLTINDPNESSLDEIPVTITVEQHVQTNQHVAAGISILQSGYRVTQQNFHEDMVVKSSRPFFQETSTLQVSIHNGQSYTIIPFPKRSRFSNDIRFTITVSTFLPGEATVEFYPCPNNSEEFKDLYEFQAHSLTGRWDLLSAGGQPVVSDRFFSNPQYGFELIKRSRVQVSLERLSDSWLPMAFFIIKTPKLHSHIEKMDFVIEPSGLIGHENEVRSLDEIRLVGQVRFTSGFEKSTFGNFTLTDGCYTIIAANGIVGRGGEFQLRLLCDSSDIDFKKLEDKSDMATVMKKGSFIGGLNTLNTSDPAFRKVNPAYTVTVDATHKVYFDLSHGKSIPKQYQPKYINLGIVIYKGDQLIQQSPTCSWHSVNCSVELIAGEKYTVYVATTNGSEGNYKLTAASNSNIEIAPVDGTISDPFDAEEIVHTAHKSFTGEWGGFSGPGVDGKVNPYNQSFTITAQKKTSLRCEMITSCKAGFKVIHNNEPYFDTGVITPSKILVKSNKIIRFFVLTIPGDYIFEPYPDVEGRFGTYSIELSSNDEHMKISPNKSKKSIVNSFQSKWNIAAASGDIKNDPKWSIVAKKETKVVFVVEKSTHTNDNDQLAFLNQSSFNELSPEIDLVPPSLAKMGILIFKTKDASSLTHESVLDSNLLVSKTTFIEGDFVQQTVVLPASKVPYIVVASCLTKKPLEYNDFKFTAYTQKKDTLTITPLSEKTFDKSKCTKTLSTTGQWNEYSTCELSTNENWIKSPMVKINLSATKATSTIMSIELKTESADTSASFKLVQPTSDNASTLDNILENNLILGDSIFFNESSIARCNLQINHLSRPLFLIPSTLYPYQVRSNFTVKASVPKNITLKLTSIKNTEEKQFIYNGVFPLLTSHNSDHIINGSDLCHEIKLKSMPKFKVKSQEKQNVRVQLKVDTPKEIGLTLRLLQEEEGKSKEVATSSLSAAGYILEDFELEAEVQYEFIPLIVPYGSSEPFLLEIHSEGDATKLEVTAMQPEYNLDLNNLSLDQSIVLQSKWSNFDGLSGIRYERLWKQFSSISLTITDENYHVIDVIMSNVNNLISIIGFYVLEHGASELQDDFTKNTIVAKSSFVPYATILKERLVLSQGKYILLPICRSIQDGEYEYGISLETDAGVNIDYSEPDFTKIESLTLSTNVYDLENSTHCFTPARLLKKTSNAADAISSKPVVEASCVSEVPHPYCKQLLNQVTKLPLLRKNVGNLDHPRYASPLSIWGPNVFPVLTGTSTARYVYSPTEIDDIKKIRRLDKLGYSYNLYVDLYQPYIGAGEHDNGRFIAIGDSSLFQRQDDEFAINISNQSFLYNCVKWVLPRSKQQNIDFIPSEQASKRPGSAGSTVSSNSTQTPLNVGNLDLTKPQLLCYCKNKDQLPLEALSFDYEVTLTYDLDSLETYDADILFLIFSNHEVLKPSTVEAIRNQIYKEGSGAIIVGNCQAFHPTEISTSFPANQILKGMGICFGDTDVMQNTQHAHSKDLWWLSNEQIEMYGLPNLFQLQKEFVEVEASRHGLAHVGQCLELYMNYYQGKAPKNVSRAEKIQFSQIFHILQSACYTIPSDDDIILPQLLKCFSNASLLVSPQQPVKYQSRDRLSLALNNHLWITKNVKDGFTLPHRPYDCNAPSQTHEVALSTKYQKIFSTGIYARSGELITVTLPEELVNHCKVTIGCNKSDYFWLRDTSLTRYPQQVRCVTADSKNVHISNAFGGLLYIEYSGDHHKKYNIQIQGGATAPVFYLGNTTPEEWQSQLRECNPSVLHCEWISEHIIITLPVEHVFTIDDPTKLLKFYDSAVQTMEDFSSVSYNYHQRITTDTQFISGVTTEGFPIAIHESLLDPVLFQVKFDAASITRELGFNMSHKHSYVWTHREFAMANVFKAYFYDHKFGIKVNQTNFYTSNIAKIKKFLLLGSFNVEQVFESPLSPAGNTGKYIESDTSSRFREYCKNNDLATMLEFVLIEAFGWEPYKKLLSAYHNDYDILNRREMTNQERVDRWVQRYSELVHYDVSEFYEKFGIKVNSGVKSRLKFYPAWMIPF